VIEASREHLGWSPDAERDLLERSPQVRIVEIPDAGHFTLNQKPGDIAKLVLEAIGQLPSTETSR
jgi:pimeloyl-ACP methyl ester carboxylesterase